MIHTPDYPNNPEYQKAFTKRQKLRILQASRKSGDWRLDKTVRELVLAVTGFVAVRLSGERLPR